MKRIKLSIFLLLSIYLIVSIIPFIIWCNHRMPSQALLDELGLSVKLIDVPQDYKVEYIVYDDIVFDNKILRIDISSTTNFVDDITNYVNELVNINLNFQAYCDFIGVDEWERKSGKEIDENNKISTMKKILESSNYFSIGQEYEYGYEAFLLLSLINEYRLTENQIIFCYIPSLKKCQEFFIKACKYRNEEISYSSDAKFLFITPTDLVYILYRNNYNISIIITNYQRMENNSLRFTRNSPYGTDNEIKKNILSRLYYNINEKYNMESFLEEYNRIMGLKKLYEQLK